MLPLSMGQHSLGCGRGLQPLLWVLSPRGQTAASRACHSRPLSQGLSRRARCPPLRARQRGWLRLRQRQRCIGQPLLACCRCSRQPHPFLYCIREHRRLSQREHLRQIHELHRGQVRSPHQHRYLQETLRLLGLTVQPVHLHVKDPVMRRLLPAWSLSRRRA